MVKNYHTLLNITEHLFIYNDSDIQNSLDNEDFITLLSSLSHLSQAQYESLKSEIFGLQVFNLGSKDLLEFVKQENNLDFLSIPLGADAHSIKLDLNKGLDIVYLVAKALDLNHITIDNLSEVDLLSMLPYAELSDVLAFDASVDEQSILLNSIVSYLNSESIDLGTFGVVTVPDELKMAPFNSALWVDELNNIVLGVLDVLETIDSVESGFVFSIQNLEQINSLDQIPARLVTGLNDEAKIEDAFSKITSSMLLKYNAVGMVSIFVDTNIEAFEVSIPLDYYKSEDLSSENLKELLKISIDVFSKTINDDDISLGMHIQTLDVATMISVFNQLDDTMIERIGYQQTINNIFRSLVTNPSIQNYLYDSINNLNIENLEPVEHGVFELDVALDENGHLHTQTLYQLLSFVNKLQIPHNIDKLETANLLTVINDRLSLQLIDDLFDIKLIHELLSNTLKLEQVKVLGNSYFTDGMQQLSASGFELSLSFDVYYNRLIEALLDQEDLISKDEIKSYLSTYIAVLNSDINQQDIQQNHFNKISDERNFLSTHYNGKNILEHLTSNEIDFVGPL